MNTTMDFNMHSTDFNLDSTCHSISFPRVLVFNSTAVSLIRNQNISQSNSRIRICKSSPNLSFLKYVLLHPLYLFKNQPPQFEWLIPNLHSELSQSNPFKASTTRQMTLAKTEHLEEREREREMKITVN